MNYRRGFFRAWMMLSVLWIAGVAFVSGPDVYQAFDQAALKAKVEKDPIVPAEQLKPQGPFIILEEPKPRSPWLALREGWNPDPWGWLLRTGAVAFLPPLALLAVGAALGRAFSGFHDNRQARAPMSQAPKSLDILEALQPPPPLRLLKVPEEERRAVNAIDLALITVYSSTRNFAAAVDLFSTTRAQKTSGNPIRSVEWMMIAARDGAMSIFHFGDVIQRINKQFGTCPTLAAHIDRSQMKAANKALRTHFPQFEKIRHAVGHTGEFNMTGGTVVQGPAVVGGIHIGGRGVVNDHLNGDVFHGVIDNEPVSYAVNATTLANMIEVAKTVYSVFAPAAEKLR